MALLPRDKTAAVPAQLPSVGHLGSMFIGLSQLRAQTSTARWHHAVFFMAANAAFITWVSAILSSKDWPHLAYATLISALAGFVNFLWSGMVKRETVWIGFYTSSLTEIERRINENQPEALRVAVFTSDRYPSKAETETTMPFHRGLKLLSTTATLLWVVSAVSCAGAVAFSLGRTGL